MRFFFRMRMLLSVLTRGNDCLSTSAYKTLDLESKTYFVTSIIQMFIVFARRWFQCRLGSWSRLQCRSGSGSRPLTLFRRCLKQFSLKFFLSLFKISIFSLHTDIFQRVHAQYVPYLWKIFCWMPFVLIVNYKKLNSTSTV
jgi:hypothetical protein